MIIWNSNLVPRDIQTLTVYTDTITMWYACTYATIYI